MLVNSREGRVEAELNWGLGRHDKESLKFVLSSETKVNEEESILFSAILKRPKENDAIIVSVKYLCSLRSLKDDKIEEKIKDAIFHRMKKARIVEDIFDPDDQFLNSVSSLISEM